MTLTTFPCLTLRDGKWLYQCEQTTYELIPFPGEERMEEVYELSKQAGFDDTLEDWKQHLRLSRFAYAFVDTATDKLITTAMGVVLDNKIVRIIDILTEKSHRNRGLASAVFSHLLSQIEQDPQLKSLELEASAAGSGLYTRFGFEKDYEIISYLLSATTPFPTVEGRLEVQNNQERDQIIRLDAAACGFSRASLMEEVPANQIFVDRAGPHIQGFLLYFEDSTGIRVGPWVQTNPANSSRFLQASLATIRKRYPSKNIYIHTPEFAGQESLLIDLGFKHDSNIQTYHMSKGQKLPRNPQTYLAAWSTNWS